MSQDAVTYLVAACAGVFSLALWIAFVVIPAWTAYQRWWERVLATILSVYVLAAMLLVGGGLAALVLYNYDRI